MLKVPNRYICWRKAVYFWLEIVCMRRCEYEVFELCCAMEGKSGCGNVSNEIICEFNENFLNLNSDVDRSFLFSIFSFWTKQIDFKLNINSDWIPNCKEIKSFCNISSFIICISWIQLILKLFNEHIWVNSFFLLSLLHFFKLSVFL